MKKLPKISLIVAIITLLIVVGLEYREFIKLHLPFPVKAEVKETLEETKKELKGDPWKVMKWLDNNMKGKSDGGLQYAQSPEESFKRGTGDCEDYAIIAKYFLEARYKEVHLVVWEGKFNPDSKHYNKNRDKWIFHAICVFKIKENIWGTMDINGFVMTYGSLEDIIRADCELRRVDVKRAFIVRFNKYAYRKLKRIINDRKNR